jgi:subtilisin family serine protease
MTAQSIIAQAEKGTYRDGELLVKFKSGVAAAASQNVHQSVGASVIRRYTAVPHLEHVKLPKGLSVTDAITQYMSAPNVESVEPNYLMRIASIIPNDTYFGNQWALLNTGQYAYGKAGADIKATDAWRVTIGSGDIVVAVLDTGIDYNHSDLSWNVWRNAFETSCTDGVDNDGNGFIDDCKGWNFIADNNDPMDDNGHGTHVAGVIGAKGNNSAGIAGLMWMVNMMPLKVCDSDGFCGTAEIIAAIDYALDFKKNKGVNLKVMNASFGGPMFSQDVKDAISAANDAGVLFIAAAGNGNGDGVGDNNDLMPMYPASYGLPNIISVAATDQDDKRVAFSNFGPTSVHVAAPGVYIWSTVPNWLSLYQGYGILETMAGTSMATPHVTGLAGLLSAYYANLTHTQVRQMILRYVDIRPSLVGWISTGGRINAFKALSSLWAPADFVATPVSPTQISLAWAERATDETGYRLERRIEGGVSYTLIQTLAANANSASDSGLIDGTQYNYRVKAFNNLGESPVYQANEASAVTPLSRPTKLKAKAVSDSEVDLTWQDNSSAESGYKIERSGFNEAFIEVAQVGPDVDFFSDFDLKPNTKYRYRVRAFNAAAGNSAFSDEAAAQTKTSGGSSSSGGGCSIGARQNTATAIADMTVMLLPLIFIAIARRRR